MNQTASTFTLRPLILGAAALVAGVLAFTLAVFLLAGGTSRRPADDLSAVAGHPVDAGVGRQLFLQNCSSCHGRSGQGMPQQGVDLVASVFVHRADNTSLLRFLKIGRRPGEPGSILNRLMPARGGNADLQDRELADIVAYLRQMQRREPAGLLSVIDLSPTGARP
jgi:mono/diheme cytochrome c family protein